MIWKSNPLKLTFMLSDIEINLAFGVYLYKKLSGCLASNFIECRAHGLVHGVPSTPFTRYRRHLQLKINSDSCICNELRDF